MHYRRLGHSGLHVSAISLGSWLTYGSRVELETARQCVREAVEAGVNLIDTADIYARGAAEEALGEILPEYKRSDLVLASKAFWPMSENVNDRGLSRKHLHESIHNSLKRLKTDYLDLYQCHRHDPNTPIREVVEAMIDLVRRGDILYWGVSCWSAAQIVEACFLADKLGGPRPISNQPHYSALYRKIEAEILPTSERFGLGQIVWSPLEGGVLTGKYRGGNVPPGTRGADEKTGRFIERWLNEETLAKVEALGTLADEVGCKLSQLALAWTLRQPGISSAIMGASRPEQVRENVAAAEIKLSAEQLEYMEKILDNRPEPVTGE